MARVKVIQKINVGDTVKVYGRVYVRGTRRPGFPGRFRFPFLGMGVLMAKDDPAAYVGTTLASWTTQKLRDHYQTHLGLQNATGAVDARGLTEGNNPVRLASGEVRWVHADQIR